MTNISHTRQVNSARNMGSFKPSNNYDFESFNEDGNTIICNCNENALLLTVRKEGINKGRQFYKCSKQAFDFQDTE